MQKHFEVTPAQVKMFSDRLAHPKYRRDIDGLRALAVLSVVGFHAAPGRIPGGFIGVDIFFVISGFLITTIIINNLDRGSFSFVEFYRRRIRRIFPALVVVLLASLVAGSLLLTPEQFENLGKHTAGGAGFYSNFLFWMESGYFDSASDMKPLLHLWSLSIEEQFYIFWPLLLWFVFTQKIAFLTVTSVIVTLSFLLNVYIVGDDTAAAFYSPLSRSWELLSGAVLAHIGQLKKGQTFYWRHSLANAMSVVGTVMILAGLLLINKSSYFPGWWALLPVLGTVLMILAGSQAWINRIILSHPVFVWFGLISYPLYLTHWPILSFLRIMAGQEITQLSRLYAIAVSVVLAWLIYSLVEKPIRFGVYSRFKITALISAMVVIGFYGFYVHQQNGLVTRIGSQPLVANQGGIGHRQFFEYMSEKFYLCTPVDIEKSMGYWEEFKRCYQSKDSPVKQVALVGDSHAEHLFIGLAEELDDLNVVYYGKGGLPFFSNPELVDIYTYLLEDRNIKVVLISAKWGRELGKITREQGEAQFDELINALTAANKSVYIIDDVPEFNFGPSKCKYDGRFGQVNICRQDATSIMSEREGYYALLTDLDKKYPGVEIINTMDFFCGNKDCSMAENGILYYRDSHHLNVEGSKRLWRHIMQNSQLAEDIQVAIEK